MNKKLHLAGIFILALTLLGTIGGTAAHEAYGAPLFKPASDGILNYSPLTAYIPINGRNVALQLGMTKGEIDLLLGKPQVIKTLSGDYYRYGEDITIGYVGTRAAMIDPGMEGALRKRVKPGQSWEQAAALLGEPTLVAGSDRIYRYQANSYLFKQLRTAKELAAAVGRSDVYEVIVSLNAFGEISSEVMFGVSYKRDVIRAIQLANSTDGLPHSHAPFVLDDLAVIDELGRTVRLGMEMADVDKLLGSHESYTMSLPIHEYDSMSVYYRGTKAVGIKPREDPAHLFRTPRGITMQSSAAILERLYGKPTAADPSSWTYYFKRKGSELQLLTEFPIMPDPDRAPYDYGISVILSDGPSPVITFLLIGDAAFLREMK
ncbi:hypothetical protein [Paenibacillus sp. OV219]|uniref:hypothetical protein n=1 Tax=Paenibacillus sp. OV219 TaxID=1884377 RepID=UPI0008AD3F0D|nr:hypothetical protein [Paenibacillus sp. OV219]SEO34739.1 hypothetical protein SAMN05518847_107160 [Paenibacillus sp. OV219]